MEIKILEKENLPFLLKQIPDPPEKLYVQGEIPKTPTKFLCIVGARKYSSYGQEVTEKLISGLRGHNICIVSGLALGIDSIAHRTALSIGLKTIAFPGSGLDPKVLYPHTHIKLAKEILEASGALISEFELEQEATPWTFPKRNRLMAGISHATIVIEAKLQSGTLITSKYATDYNRDVGAVPGQIFSSLSLGPHMLLGLGAKVITKSSDILELLDLKSAENTEQTISQKVLPLNLDENQKRIVDYLSLEPQTTETLLYKTHLPARDLNLALSILEIENLVEIKNGQVRLRL